jgi:hypothetical protein
MEPGRFEAQGIAGFTEAFSKCSQRVGLFAKQRDAEKSNHRHRLLLRARSDRPCGRNSNCLDEIAPSHLPAQGLELAHDGDGLITSVFYGWRNGFQGSVCMAAILSRACPLWVKSRHRTRFTR